MASNPTVSIGMSVLNNERTVGQAVRSIVNQTFQDWELLVFDDGSTDETADIVRGFQDPRIRLLQDGENKGLPARLNEAVDAASGELFARMDGDDVSYPERLGLQVDYLRSHPDVDLVGGGVMVFFDETRVTGKRIAPEAHAVICRAPYRGFPMAHPTYCGRLAWFKKHRYSEQAVRCEDQDMLLRAFRTSKYANVQQIVLGYREQLSFTKIIRSRWYFAQRMFVEYARNGHPIIGCWGCVEQLMKSGVDAIALGSGLDHALLRHRAGPITREEEKRWAHVLFSAQHPAGTDHII